MNHNKNAKSTPGAITKTVPALAGLVYAASASVQFLGAEIYIGVADWSFSSEAALITSLAAFIVVFASSKTRDWRFYDGYEQAIVGLAIAIMLTHEYSDTIQLAVSNNQPYAGLIAFMTGMVAWGVLAR